MANTVMAGALLTPGIRAEFVEVWSPIYDGLKGQFGDIIWLDATSDKLTEIYAFLESTPYPERWDRGTVIPAKNFKSRQFSVTNRDWGFRIYHHSNDEGDDQTGSLMAKVRELAQNWVILDEEIIYQFIQDAANPRLLPAVPNSADGNDLYTTAPATGPRAATRSPRRARRTSSRSSRTSCPSSAATTSSRTRRTSPSSTPGRR